MTAFEDIRTRAKPRCDLRVHAHAATRNPSDQVVLIAFFSALFALHFGLRLASPAFADPGAAAFNAAQMLGFAAIAVVLERIGGDRILQRRDFTAIMIAAIMLVHPWQGAGVFVMTGLGLWFLRRRDRCLVSLGQLCLGLACLEFWGRAALTLVADGLLPLETALAFAATSPFGPVKLVGNSILASNWIGISVYAQCSALNAMFATTFIWLSLVKIENSEFQRWQFQVLAKALLAVLLINTTRLALMAQSENQYLVMHAGIGAKVASIAMLAAVFGLYYIGLRRKRLPLPESSCAG